MSLFDGLGPAPDCITNEEGTATVWRCLNEFADTMTEKNLPSFGPVVLLGLMYIVTILSGIHITTKGRKSAFLKSVDRATQLKAKLTEDTTVGRVLFVCRIGRDLRDTITAGKVSPEARLNGLRLWQIVQAVDRHEAVKDVTTKEITTMVDLFKTFVSRSRADSANQIQLPEATPAKLKSQMARRSTPLPKSQTQSQPPVQPHVPRSSH